MSRPVSYGFKINDNNLLQLADFLKKKRIENDLKFIDISKVTNIDISTLHKLEQGAIQRINPFMLIEIAKLYEINVVILYELVGYIRKNEIIDYYNYNVKNFSIPKINNNQELDIFIHSLIDKDNLSFVNLDNKNLIIYDKNYSKISTGDFTLFRYENQNIVSEYNQYKDIFFIINILDNSKFFISKNQIKVIGLIKYIINIQNY